MGRKLIGKKTKEAKKEYQKQAREKSRVPKHDF